jgi:hypothetical protein
VSAGSTVPTWTPTRAAAEGVGGGIVPSEIPDSRAIIDRFNGNAMITIGM